MKFLLDVNAGGPIATSLGAQGHDVALVASRNTRMEDHLILAWAAAEDRIIVTTDLDFEQMVWRDSKLHCGLLRNRRRFWGML